MTPSPVSEFPWDAIHTESLYKALLTHDLKGYFQRQEQCRKKLFRHLKRIRKEATK